MSSGQRLSSSGTPSSAMSAQDLRARRLAALSERGGAPINPSTPTITPQVRNEEQISTEELPVSFLSEFLTLLFDTGSTTDADRRRWFTQPIHTRFSKDVEEIGKEPKSPEKHHMWGLVQTYGGPCGVIAAIQADIIQGLELYDDAEKIVTPEESKRALCRAIATILARCAVAPPVDTANARASKNGISVEIILPIDNEITIENFLSSKLKVVSIPFDNVKRPRSTIGSVIQNLSKATEEFLMEGTSMKHFGSPIGVILFLLCLLKTRGVANIKSGKDL